MFILNWRVANEYLMEVHVHGRFMILSIIGHFFSQPSTNPTPFILAWSDHYQQPLKTNIMWKWKDHVPPKWCSTPYGLDTRTSTWNIPETSSLCITSGQHWTTKYSEPECMQSFQRPYASSIQTNPKTASWENMYTRAKVDGTVPMSYWFV